MLILHVLRLLSFNYIWRSQFERPRLFRLAFRFAIKAWRGFWVTGGSLGGGGGTGERGGGARARGGGGGGGGTTLLFLFERLRLLFFLLLFFIDFLELFLLFLLEVLTLFIFIRINLHTFINFRTRCASLFKGVLLFFFMFPNLFNISFLVRETRLPLTSFVTLYPLLFILSLSSLLFIP